MTLQRAAVLYPIAQTIENTGPINIRCLDDVQPGATVAGTTIVNSTQGTNAERRFNPLQGPNSDTTNAATTNGNKGFAIPLSDAIGDMAVGAGSVAWLKAQTLTMNMSGAATGTGTGAIGANDALTPKVSLWRYDPVAHTGTLIVGGAGSAVSIPCTVAYSGTAWSGSVSVSVPETLFDADEILMIVVGGNLACGAATIGSRTTTWRLDLDISTTNLTFATSGLLELAETTGSSSGSGAATGTGGMVLGTVGSAAGVGAASGVLGAVGGMVGSAAGSAAVAGLGSSVAGAVGTAAGSAVVSGQASIVLGTVGTVDIGGGGGITIIKRPIFLFDD